MNAEFNQTLRGRWTATRPLGLGVPKIKIRHHKKCLVQPDSLEAGAGIPAPLTAQGEPHVFFFLSFLSFFLSFILPRCWPQIGPGTGFLCFFAGPGTGCEAPVLAFYVSLLAPVLALRPRYWPWRRPPGWLIAIFPCRQYCVIKYLCLILTKDAFLVWIHGNQWFWFKCSH